MEILGASFLPVGGKKEKETFGVLRDLSGTVVKSVRKFEEAVEAYSELDFDEGGELLSELDELESEADRYGIEFESRLGEGAFLPVFRGDLSRLSESIDDMVDAAESATREIYRRPRVFEDLARAEEEEDGADSIRLGLVDLSGKAMASAESLASAARSM